MPDGSLEASMQLVYERKSCNITLHRGLSGPTQRALLLPFLPYPHCLAHAQLWLNGLGMGWDHWIQGAAAPESRWHDQCVLPFAPTSGGNHTVNTLSYKLLFKPFFQKAKLPIYCTKCQAPKHRKIRPTLLLGWEFLIGWKWDSQGQTFTPFA